MQALFHKVITRIDKARDQLIFVARTPIVNC